MVLLFVGLGVIAIGIAVYAAKKHHGKTPSVQPSGYLGPPPPAPPNSTYPMGGGPSDYIDAAINLNDQGIRTACSAGGMDPKVCDGIVKVNDVVIKDTIVKPAEWAYNKVSSWF